jgi:glutathione synthase/RimK-type ligase-like ATP-grasp enzyme
MILVLGSSADKVFPYLVDALTERGHAFVAVDEDRPAQYSVACEATADGPIYRISGGDCDGSRRIGVIFVRHAVLRTLEPAHSALLGLLQLDLNRLLDSACCPIVNQPANAFTNYAKPFQVSLLAAAGFDVPNSLVTNDPCAARRFAALYPDGVIFKGVSSMMTFAQILQPHHEERIDLLPSSPTLFQEYVAGVDYRVHILDDDVFVTRLQSQREDYRRSVVGQDPPVLVEPAELPPAVIERCVAFARSQGLVLSGMDFKEAPDGRLVALELNPFPQFTFYERRGGQQITRAVADYLAAHASIAGSNVFA